MTGMKPVVSVSLLLRDLRMSVLTNAKLSAVSHAVSNSISSAECGTLSIHFVSVIRHCSSVLNNLITPSPYVL